VEFFFRTTCQTGNRKRKFFFPRAKNAPRQRDDTPQRDPWWHALSLVGRDWKTAAFCFRLACCATANSARHDDTRLETARRPMRRDNRKTPVATLTDFQIKRTIDTERHTTKTKKKKKKKKKQKKKKKKRERSDIVHFDVMRSERIRTDLFQFQRRFAVAAAVAAAAAASMPAAAIADSAGVANGRRCGAGGDCCCDCAVHVAPTTAASTFARGQRCSVLVVFFFSKSVDSDATKKQTL
jgi:hypothetical protein